MLLSDFRILMSFSLARVEMTSRTTMRLRCATVAYSFSSEGVGLQAVE